MYGNRIIFNQLKPEEFNVTLNRPNGITELSETTVTVSVEVDNSVSREFTVDTIEFRNLADGYSVQASSQEDTRVTVVVSGSADIVNNLDASSITAYVNLEGYGVGEHEVDVRVVRSNVLLTYTPRTRQVRVRISEG